MFSSISHIFSTVFVSSPFFIWKFYSRYLNPFTFCISSPSSTSNVNSPYYFFLSFFPNTIIIFVLVYLCPFNLDLFLAICLWTLVISFMILLCFMLFITTFPLSFLLHPHIFIIPFSPLLGFNSYFPFFKWECFTLIFLFSNESFNLD